MLMCFRILIFWGLEKLFGNLRLKPGDSDRNVTRLLSNQIRAAKKNSRALPVARAAFVLLLRLSNFLSL